MNQKKRELEQWEKDECAALKEAIAELNRARPKNERITQEVAGEALGMNQGSFSNYLNGRTALNLDFALKLLNTFGIPIEKYSPRLATEIREKYEIFEKQEKEKTERAHTAISRAVPKDLEYAATTFWDLNRFFESCESDGLERRRGIVRNARNHAVHHADTMPRIESLYRLFYAIAAAEIDGHLSDHDIGMLNYLITAIDAKYENQEEIKTLKIRESGNSN